MCSARKETNSRSNPAEREGTSAASGGVATANCELLLTSFNGGNFQTRQTGGALIPVARLAASDYRPANYDA